MEIYPSFIIRFAEEKGKEISDLTIEDWREAALAAANSIEPLPKIRGKPGRPRKNLIPTTVNALLASMHPKKYQYRFPRPLGRRKASYYGKPIEWYSDLLKDLRKMRPAQPKRQLLSMVLQFMEGPNRNSGYHDPEAVEKALRRHKADKNKQ